MLEIFFCLVLLPTKSKNNTSVYSISLTHFKLTGLLDQYNHCKNATSQLIKICLIVWSRRDTRSAVWHESLVATINYTFICSEGHMIKTILSTGVFGTKCCHWTSGLIMSNISVWKFNKSCVAFIIDQKRIL